MSTGDFPWVGDIGTASVAQIEQLARMSGTDFRVTSTYRPGANDYHGSHNAVDMASSAASMVKLASYLYQYSPYLLELIHSGGPGFFVKNGHRGYKYSDTIISQHYNHVHCATTLSALKAASTGKLTIPHPAPDPGPGGTNATPVSTSTAAGCGLTLVVSLGQMITLLEGLSWLHR